VRLVDADDGDIMVVLMDGRDIADADETAKHNMRGIPPKVLWFAE
jgi:hypothetical protein